MSEVSRRSVLIGLGGAALAANPLLAACSTDSESSSDGGGASEPRALTVPTDWDYPVLEGATLPFGHAVASGDPLADRVILWTRLTIPDPALDGIEDVEVTWRIATDEALTDVVAEGTARTDPSYDWTVNVEPTGLEPGTAYFYGFEALGHASPVGRTRTAPADLAQPVTVAAVACSSYWSGWFNAYGRIATNDEVDLVVHVGDHIYDTVDPEEWVRARGDRFDPEYVDFRDWRSVDEVHRRYALHYADADTAAMRSTKPMVIAWDNHDVASGTDDAVDDRECQEAFWRWTASRPVNATERDGQVVPTDPTVGHRLLAYGPVDLFVLDGHTRDDDTSLLGIDQRTWLEGEMAASAAAAVPWRMVLSPKPVGHFDALGSPAYPGWSDRDGDRAHLLDHLVETGTTDNVFVSGDAHGAFIWDLPADQTPAGYDPETGRGSAGIEIGCNSVTRGGADERVAEGIYAAANDEARAEADREAFAAALEEAQDLATATAAVLVNDNPSMHYANWTDHGYGLVTLTTDDATVESWLVPKQEPTTDERLDARYVARAGTDHLVAEA